MLLFLIIDINNSKQALLSSYRCYLQDWYYGKVKSVKGKEPLEEQMGIFPKSFVTMTKESDPIPDRMKYAIVNVCSGYKNSWFEAKEYDTRYVRAALINTFWILSG